MSETTLKYFEEYRSKIKYIKQCTAELSDLERQVEKKRGDIWTLTEEVRGMQRIITMMIDNDMDPVEVKLITEPNDRNKSFWNTNSLELNHTYDTSSQSPISNVTGVSIVNLNSQYACGTGATGAYGALGSIGQYAGANASSPYAGMSGPAVLTTAKTGP
jgi:hypothetical protein